MGSNTKTKGVLILCICAVIFSAQFAAAAGKQAAAKKKPAAAAKAHAAPKKPAAAKYTPQSLWAATATKWDKEVNSYHCKLFTWTYKTDEFIKNFPELNKPPKPGEVIKRWDYRIFDLRFKKPDKALVGYDLLLRAGLL